MLGSSPHKRLNMYRTLTTHWLLEVSAYTAAARSWIACGKRGSNAVTSRANAALHARACLRVARRCGVNFVACIKERRAA